METFESNFSKSLRFASSVAVKYSFEALFPSINTFLICSKVVADTGVWQKTDSRTQAHRIPASIYRRRFRFDDRHWRFSVRRFGGCLPHIDHIYREDGGGSGSYI